MIVVMKLLLLSVITTLLLILAPAKVVLAQFTYNTPSAEITYQDINPTDGYQYLLKRLKENIWLAMLAVNNGAKADFYLKLVEIRLAELKYTVDKGDISNVETVSRRYAATAGQATELISSVNPSIQRQILVDKLEQHILILKSLQSAFGNDELKAGWRFLEDDINSLKSYLSELKSNNR